MNADKTKKTRRRAPPRSKMSGPFRKINVVVTISDHTLKVSGLPKLGVSAHAFQHGFWWAVQQLAKNRNLNAAQLEAFQKAITLTVLDRRNK